MTLSVQSKHLCHLHISHYTKQDMYYDINKMKAFESLKGVNTPF